MRLSLLLTGLLAAVLQAEPLGEHSPIGRVLERFNPAVVFHAGYDAGVPDADLAAGAWQPLKVEGTVSFAPGLVGQALASGAISYAAAQNVEFRMPGTILLWLSIGRSTPPSPQEGYSFPLRVYASDPVTPHGMLMIGKSDRANGAGVYVHVEASGQKRGQVHAGSSRDWRQDEWHLFAVTWRRGLIELSLDGAPPQMAVAPSLPTRPSQFIVAASDDPASGYRCLVDELLILNRPLAPEEVQWVYRTLRP